MTSMRDSIAKAVFDATYGRSDWSCGDVADAVLVALLKPTPEMIDAAPEPTHMDENWPHHLRPVFGWDHGRHFVAMIEAAQAKP